jgi:D-ribose pyranase
VKRSGILNAELARALASMGHGDGLLVVDAGFPVPADSVRIDLAFVQDQPDLRTVLDGIGNEFIAERIVVADEVRTHNAPLHDWLAQRWPTTDLETIPHTQMLATAAAQAKAVVRTGAFEPWGNVLLISGVDVPSWFTAPGVVVPEYYVDRMAGTQ